MANPNNPHGLTPVGHLRGGSVTSQPRMFNIPSTDTNQYAVGDVVKSLAGCDAVGIPQCIIAGNTDTPRGVIVGIVVAPTLQGQNVGTPNLNLQKIPATKTQDYYVLVDEDPDTIFEVQANNTGTLNTNVFGKNCNLATATPGTYVSATVLGTGATGASAATTSTLQMKILGLAQRPNVDLTANAPLLVKFNIHELGSVGTTGV